MIMYLSPLLIDVGTDPDRPRPGRLWLRNLYRVHQRLCMAFPDADRREQDPDFLAPFRPEDFPLLGPDKTVKGLGKHVHIPRADKSGFLFRVDPQPGANPVILVQSVARPDWKYAFHNAGYLLAAAPEVREINPQFTVAQRLRFRLKANTVRRATEGSRDSAGQPLDPKWVGKRVPVQQDRAEEWVTRRGKTGGFRLIAVSSTVAGYTYFSKTGERGARQRLFSVLFDGVLEVTDPAAFITTLHTGIGAAKAFGFGLLSVTPLRE